MLTPLSIRGKEEILEMVFDFVPIYHLVYFLVGFCSRTPEHPVLKARTPGYRDLSCLLASAFAIDQPYLGLLSHPKTTMLEIPIDNQLDN